MGKVSVVGAGMKSHPGVAARVFSTLGDEGINIEMISTSPIKISCVVRARPSTAPCARCTSAFELGADQVEAEHPFGAGARDEPTASPSWAPPAPSAPSCSPSCASAASRASEIVPFASERSAGKELDGAIVQPLSDETIQGFDLALFSRRRLDLRRVGAALRRRRRRRRRQLLQVAPRPRGPARRLRGQPGGARRPQGPDRQPELLDDAADGRAQADPRRGRHRAADRLDLPVRLRHRREGRRRARGADPRGPARHGARPSRRSTRTRSRSTSSAAPATSPTATTTRTRSAR